MNLNQQDIDFIHMMTDHHLDAIKMSLIEIQNGENAEVIALANEIITAQSSEILKLISWLKEENSISTVGVHNMD